MNFVTYHQYMKYILKNNVLIIAEGKETYNLEISEQKKALKETDKKHDKMIRNTLNKTKEMVKFLNQFLKLKEITKEEQIIQCHTNFITKEYKEKNSDIVYKLKDKPIYFLVEHQSTVDKEMPERMARYIEEIMVSEKKENVYPIVVPIVLYTGLKKWNAKTSIAQKQYNSYKYEDYKINLKYNLIAIQDYTFEELLKNKTVLSSIMIIEKSKTKEILEKRIEEIINIITDKEDKKLIEDILRNVIAPMLGKEKTKRLIEKIHEKEVVGMSPVTKLTVEIIEERRKAIQKGAQKAILKTVKRMLKKNMNLKDIRDLTDISEEELKKLQEQLSM